MNNLIKNAIIVDFDGTLFITEHLVLKKAKEKYGRELSIETIRALPRDEKVEVYLGAFSQYGMQSKPNLPMIKEVKKQQQIPRIYSVLLTAKTPDSKVIVDSLLQKENINFDKKIFRPSSMLTMHDEEWKLGELRKLIKGMEEIRIYEDKMENIKYFMDNLDNGKSKLLYYHIDGGKIREVKTNA